MATHYLDILAKTINKNWDNPALTDFYLTEDGTAQDTSRGNRYTYGEMYMEMLRLEELFRSLALQKGDHVAICGANSAHWAIAYLAIAAYQGVAVTILHSQSTEDIAHQIDFSDAKVLFADEDIWAELKEQTLPQIKHVIDLEDWSWMPSNASAERQSTDSQPTVKANVTAMKGKCQFTIGEPDELAMICFTSGTSGNSKGVMLSYGCIVNNLENLLQTYVLSNNSHSLIFLSFSHASGLLCDLLLQLLRGKYVYVFSDVHSSKNIYQSLKIVQPYMIFIVPKVLSVLCNSYNLLEIISLHQIVTAGAQLDSKTESRLKEMNIPLTNEYGQTECLCLSSCLPNHHKYSSVGKILNNFQVNIALSGEILVKGKNVMLGYYKDPEATACKIDADGWLHTGDKGHLDEEGYLYVEGRLEQDMIVLPNGENIHPEDIESKINAIPNVKESIVVSRNGKLVAIVVLTNSNLSQQDILNVVNPQLPLYSQLYDIELLEKPLERTEKQTLKRYLYTKKTNF